MVQFEHSESESGAATSKTSSVNGEAAKRKDGEKRSKKKSKKSGLHRSSKRRHSISKAARDPRDEPESPPPKKSKKEEGTVTRSPSPVIDFDGLSRPSRFPYCLDAMSLSDLQFCEQ